MPPGGHDGGSTAESVVALRPRRLLSRMLRPMLEAQVRERDILIDEFVRVRGMMSLLMKRRNGDRWSRQDRIELQQQLQALAHLSPYLAALALPGSFVMLPALAWWLDRRRRRRN